MIVKMYRGGEVLPFRDEIARNIEIYIPFSGLLLRISETDEGEAQIFMDDTMLVIPQASNHIHIRKEHITEYSDD